MNPRERLKELIQEKCVLHGDFVLASGQRSKVFFDCKRATLDPEGVHLIATLILETLDRIAVDDGRPIDAIGGPTIGADPIVGHVAGLSWEQAVKSTGSGSETGAPRPLRAFLVRKAMKDHGTQRVIENDIPRGARVAMVEDVVTTGGSTLQAIRQVEEAGLEVAVVLAVIDREQGGAKTLTGYRY
ncbi:MAG: orotate phosphoribosyltransferase, partial [Acidobacteria bacterium]|nr:orotate phosphoribosyltransferase [Acidobacteriota bacterium]